MAKFSTASNNVTTDLANGMSWSEFQQSDSYDNVVGLLDVPDNATAQFRNRGGQWTAVRDNTRLTSTTEVRFNVPAGAKGRSV